MESKEIYKILEKSNMGSIFAKTLLDNIEKRNEHERKHIMTLINEVCKRMDRLENVIDKQYVRSEDFQNFIIKTFKQASNDLRHEKFKMFANIIANSALTSKANPNDRWKYLYAETIDKIDEDLFDFLLKVKSRCITKGHELDLGWTGNEPELKDKGIDLTTFRTNGDYLMSTGLMTRIHQSRYDKDAQGLTFQDEYYVTEFGIGFIEYVREYDTFEEADADFIS